MTDISHHAQEQSLDAPRAGGRQPGRPGRLIFGVRLFGVTAAVIALILVGLDIAWVDTHFAVYAAACFVLAGLAGGLVCINALLADRQEFYRRGQVDGWVKGWRGEDPNVDDPLLR